MPSTPVVQYQPVDHVVYIAVPDIDYRMVVIDTC